MYTHMYIHKSGKRGENGGKIYIYQKNVLCISMNMCVRVKRADEVKSSIRSPLGLTRPYMVIINLEKGGHFGNREVGGGGNTQKG